MCMAFVNDSKVQNSSGCCHNTTHDKIIIQTDWLLCGLIGLCNVGQSLELDYMWLPVTEYVNI